MQDEAAAVGTRHVVEPQRRRALIAGDDHALESRRLAGRQRELLRRSSAVRDADVHAGDASDEPRAGIFAQPFDLGHRVIRGLGRADDCPGQRMPAAAFERGDERQQPLARPRRSVLLAAQARRPHASVPFCRESSSGTGHLLERGGILDDDAAPRAVEIAPMMATGIAMMSGQGVAMMTTLRKRSGCPVHHQTPAASASAIGV